MRAQQSLAGMTTRRLALRSLLLALTLLGTGCAAPDDNAEATLLDSHVAFVRPRVEVPAGPPLAPPGAPPIAADRKRVAEGKGVSVRVELGGRGILHKKKQSQER